MRTIFALIRQYEDARRIVDRLIDKNIEKENINIIAQKTAVESAWDVNERTIGVDVTKEIGQKKVEGLDAMLGRLQPVRTNTAGELYVTGEIAKMITHTAAAPGEDSGLERALADFGVGESSAEEYAEGIRSGEMLVFVRSDDQRASEVKDLLSDTSARSLSTFGQ